MELSQAAIRRAQRAQRDLAPRESLRPYAGQWVAVRKRRIVASNPDLKLLLEDPRVRPGDGFIPVHEHSEGPLIL